MTDLIEGYQEITPLTIGELWAMPTMLRLGPDQLSEPCAGERAPDPMARDDTADDLIRIAGRTLRTPTSSPTPFRACTHLDRQDWADFFEDTSLVEQSAAHRSGSSAIRAMDFETRDYYRDSRSGTGRWTASADELDVAEQAIRLAQQSRQPRPIRPVVNAMSATTSWAMVARWRSQLGYRAPGQCVA